MGIESGSICHLSSRSSSPHNVDHHHAPPPCATVKVKPFGRGATLTPIVVVAGLAVPAPGRAVHVVASICSRRQPQQLASIGVELPGLTARSQPLI